MALGKPKERISRIHHDMKALAATLREAGDIGRAVQCEQAGARVDVTAMSLGLKGAAIRNTGAYANAVQLYRMVTGKPYQTGV